MSEENAEKTVAVIGASNDRSKFGNMAVRAYRSEGWAVYPVNPREDTIEGLKAYSSISEIIATVTRAVLYLPPSIVLNVLVGIAQKGVREIYFNPGTESPEAIAKSRELGLETRLECAIVAIGRTPSNPD
jgi:predicted CoA-binding protein